jgi:hypothetical protein
LTQGSSVGVAEPIGIADAATVLAGVFWKKHLLFLPVCRLATSSIASSPLRISHQISLSVSSYVFMPPALSSPSTLFARCPAMRGTNNGIPHLLKAGNFVVHQKTLSVTITSA